MRPLPPLIDSAGSVLGIQTGRAELRQAAMVPEPIYMARGGAENSGAMLDLGTVESMSRNDNNYSGNCPSTTASPGFQH